ncbi:MAG TPA: DUF6064 family protein [Dongiaceae bacterium]|nr:DUF6064 family protein [Dongiaceae bacterium]
MSDWASYTLADFLLFSARAYWRMFELHNQVWWPLPLATMAAGIAALAVAILQPRHYARWIALILAVLWAWIAWSFFWQRYAEINWAAAYVAPIFASQAMLLAIGAWGSRLRFDRRGAIGRVGFALVILAIFAYPLLAPAFDRPLAGAEIFGMAPDPTTIGTLGFLLLTHSRWTLALLPIPLLWVVMSGVTLWAMHSA